MLRKISLILLMIFLAQTQSMYYVKEGKDDSTLSSFNQTISSSDGSVNVTIPCTWSNDDWELEDGMLLDLHDNNYDMYIGVYYLDGNTVEKCMDDLKDYYGSEIIGSVKLFVINGVDGAMFEYRHVGKTVNDDNAQFHGFEYIFNAPDGVIELTAYRSFVEPNLDNAPTDKELSAMKRIAESLKIFKTSEL